MYRPALHQLFDTRIVGLLLALLCRCQESDPSPQPSTEDPMGDSVFTGEAGSEATSGRAPGSASPTAGDASAGSAAAPAGVAFPPESPGEGGPPGPPPDASGAADDAEPAPTEQLPASPAVALPKGVSSLFPEPGAEGLCPDPPLRLSFSGAPTLGDRGKVQIFDRSQPGRPVSSIDLGLSPRPTDIGGKTFNLPRQAYVEGHDVVLYPQPRALAYARSYYVTVDDGALRDADGSALVIDDSSTWSFTVRDESLTDRSTLAVGLEGRPEFCSPQGALDAIPSANRDPVRVNIGVGTYHGIVYFADKHNITLHGEDRQRVVLKGVNNNNLNPSTKTRALFGADAAQGLTIENLTLHNLTPQGGSQAEALRLQNCDRCTVRDADILSLQDTLLWSGRLYAHNCLIAGNVDFIWGDGTAYFDACEIRTVGRSGPIVQARNGVGANGYVFVDSHLSSDPGLSGSTLARIDVSAYPGSHVAYVDCTLGEHISAEGWTITGGAPPRSLRLEEYGSKNEAGIPLDTRGRLAGTTQLSAEQAAALREPARVLGGWTP